MASKFPATGQSRKPGEMLGLAVPVILALLLALVLVALTDRGEATDTWIILKGGNRIIADEVWQGDGRVFYNSRGYLGSVPRGAVEEILLPAGSPTLPTDLRKALDDLMSYDSGDFVQMSPADLAGYLIRLDAATAEVAGSWRISAAERDKLLEELRGKHLRAEQAARQKTREANAAPEPAKAAAPPRPARGFYPPGISDLVPDITR